MIHSLFSLIFMIFRNCYCFRCILAYLLVKLMVKILVINQTLCSELSYDIWEIYMNLGALCFLKFVFLKNHSDFELCVPYKFDFKSW